jgi:hypothetical protein
VEQLPPALNDRRVEQPRGFHDDVVKLPGERAGHVFPHVVIEAVELVDGVVGQVAASNAGVVDSVAATTLREVPARRGRWVG